MSLDPWMPNVAPINRLVDDISGILFGASCPYVSPEHGGISASVLSILSNPGSGAAGRQGSGFLTINNNDPTSRVQRTLFSDAGIAMAAITPWNACPWYINDGRPKERDVYRGIAAAAHLQVLGRVIDEMPELKVVLLQGNDAQIAWEAFSCAGATVHHQLTVVSTVHPLGNRRRDQSEQQAVEQQRVRAFSEVARCIS